jgi:NAD(P)-dependent dehydrogenase (short-subunit alcohol dehydrogenase family)
MSKTAIVTGTASGLGSLISERLAHEGVKVYGIDSVQPSRRLVAGEFHQIIDLTKPLQYVLMPDLLGVDFVINCAGVNRVDWLGNTKVLDWDLTMDVNARAIFLMVRRYLAALRYSKGTVLNIVSNAAHLPMRCSAAYNASKGAALMLTKQLARELAPDITVFSISPNKLNGTGMSKEVEKRVVETRGWTEEEAKEYQLSTLHNKEETDPRDLAEFIAYILGEKRRHKWFAGCDIPYGL